MLSHETLFDKKRLQTEREDTHGILKSDASSVCQQQFHYSRMIKWTGSVQCCFTILQNITNTTQIGQAFDECQKQCWLCIIDAFCDCAISSPSSYRLRLDHKDQHIFCDKKSWWWAWWNKPSKASLTRKWVFWEQYLPLP